MENSSSIKCYICSSNKHIDDHHIDCQEGKVSPETVPLCRRCHRTYHDLGLDWFDDDVLDKAIEMENKTRVIHATAGIRSKFYQPEEPLVLLRREDIQRSQYYNKTHGIKATKPVYSRVRTKFPNSPCLPGEEWLEAHYLDPYPEPTIEITVDGGESISLKNGQKGMIRKFMRGGK